MQAARTACNDHHEGQVYIFAVFLFAYILSQFFRSFLAVIAPELSTDIGLTASELGGVSAAWFAAFALAQFPVGWALDQIGPRRTVPATMLLAVAGCILFGTATSTLSVAIAMALIGLGCAPVYMGALYYFGRTYDARYFALLSSWLLGIGSAGNLLAATPLAVAVSVVGWRNMFFAVAAITALAALLVGLLIKDPPPAGASSTQEDDGEDGRRPSAIQAFVAVLRIRQLWPLLPLALIGYGTVAVERGLWVGPFLTDVHGLEPVARGNAVLVMAITMSLGAIAYGPLDQWFGTKKWVVAGGTLLTAAGFLFLYANPQLDLAVTQWVLASIGATGLTYGVLMAHARSFLPDHLLGRGITAINFLMIGGPGLLQIFSGHIVRNWQSEQLPAHLIYAQLHGLFGILLIAACAIYLTSRDAK
jgi:MFS family permease